MVAGDSAARPEAEGDKCPRIYCTRGRIAFWKPGQEPSSGHTCGQHIFYLGPDYDAFERSFEHFGGLVIPMPGRDA